MAVTQLADIIEPSLFQDYVQLRSTELSALMASGIVTTNPEFDRLAKAGGRTINMPFFNDLDGSSESNVGSDVAGTLATADKITTGQDVSALHLRNKSWASTDITAAVAGADPMSAIGNLVAGYWTKDWQRLLIASLTGVIADNIANDSSDMVNTIGNDSASAVAAAELISSEAIIDTQATMGDAGETLTAIAMHSVPYNRLKVLQLIDYVQDATNPLGERIPTYFGKRVIVDDLCPAVAGTNRIMYTSYLFAEGAVGLGFGAPRVPAEVERVAAGGNGEGVETLHSRQHFIMHPRGIKYLGASQAGASPTNAELALAANWDRVYDRKLIRFGALQTNG